jgi:hypothetical protein
MFGIHEHADGSVQLCELEIDLGIDPRPDRVNCIHVCAIRRPNDLLQAVH